VLMIPRNSDCSAALHFRNKFSRSFPGRSTCVRTAAVHHLQGRGEQGAEGSVLQQLADGHPPARPLPQQGTQRTISGMLHRIGGVTKQPGLCRNWRQAAQDRQQAWGSGPGYRGHWWLIEHQHLGIRAPGRASSKPSPFGRPRSGGRGGRPRPPARGWSISSPTLSLWAAGLLVGPNAPPSREAGEAPTSRASTPASIVACRSWETQHRPGPQIPEIRRLAAKRRQPGSRLTTGRFRGTAA